MASTGLSPTERAERAEAKIARERKHKQAMKLRFIEGGTFAAGSFGLGGLKARFPDSIGAGWFGGRLQLEHVLAAAGGALLLLAKGSTQEVGSGLLYAGAGPVLAGLGARVLTPA